MFKRIVLFLVCLSPFLFLFAGYPLSSKPDEAGVSRRCFKTGELGEYAKCLQNGQILRGADLAGRMDRNLSSMFPYLNGVFFLMLAVSLVQLTQLLDD